MNIPSNNMEHMSNFAIFKERAIFTVMDILLPTYDIYADIDMSVSAFKTGHVKFAFMLILPTLVHFVFTYYAWKKRMENREDQKRKKITFALLMLQVWPQFEALKIVQAIGTEPKKEMEQPAEGHSLETVHGVPAITSS